MSTTEATGITYRFQWLQFSGVSSLRRDRGETVAQGLL